MKSVTFAFAALLIGAAPALAASPAKVMQTSDGKVLADQNGMTLYSYDKDEAGKSNCYNKCAVNWPPFKAGGNAMAEGNWTVVERTDGTKMWAYDGKPLYTFIGDKAAGDVNGDAKFGVWHVINAE